VDEYAILVLEAEQRRCSEADDGALHWIADEAKWRSQVYDEPVERIDPPSALVTRALNAVATDGWTVHHVAEDRTMEGDAVALVAVRYLLRRPA
jgi:hypothetical protein